MKSLIHTILLINLVLLGLAGEDFLSFTFAVLRDGDAIFQHLSILMVCSIFHVP